MNETSYRRSLTWSLLSSGARAWGSGVGTHQKWGLLLVLRGNWRCSAYITREGRLDWGWFLKQDLDEATLRWRERWKWWDQKRRSRCTFMNSCMKVLQLFYYVVEHFLFLHKAILVFDTLSLPPCECSSNNPERYLWTCFGEGWIEWKGSSGYPSPWQASGRRGWPWERCWRGKPLGPLRGKRRGESRRRGGTISY